MPTVAEIFEQMPGRFNAAKAGNLNASVLFDLTGGDGGKYLLNVVNGQPAVTKLEADDTPGSRPDATVHMDANDYVDMSTGKLNPMTAFMSGKVRVEGDLNSVMKIQQLFGM